MARPCEWPRFTQSGITGTALQVMLNGDACPVIDSATQSHMRGVAHGNDVGLATAFCHGRDAGQSSEGLIVTTTDWPRRLGEQRGEIDFTDAW